MSTSVQFEEQPKVSQLHGISGIDTKMMIDGQDIDPDDDMAGLMREMNDACGPKKPTFNESINSETSTDTAFSITTPMSDKDDPITL